jgi:thiamine-phosphate pyrophosphorylase
VKLPSRDDEGRRVGMRARPIPQPPLLVITDASQASQSLPEIAAAAFAGGCRWLSLREKGLRPEDRLALLRRLVALGRRWDARVMVHDDVDAALVAGAAGVHLPAGGSPAAARRRLGAGALIGFSAHDAAEIARGAGEGADYVTLSPLFASASKPGYGPALGSEGFARLAADAPLPVIALGGIADPAEIGAAVAAGAAGVAVMGAVMAAADPFGATQTILRGLAAALAASQGRRP